MTRRHFLALVLTTLAFLPALDARADEKAWKAGVATANITPEEFTWMSGYASRKGPAEGKLTDLWAKALVLEDAGGHRVALVTLDLVGIDRGTSNAIRDRVEKEHGLTRKQTALCTSHTHTGPVVGENLGTMYFLDAEQAQRVTDYTAKLIDDVVNVVGRAVEDLAPAKLSHGSGETDFAVNRRNNREADVPMLREAGELRGPVDHDVPVLAVHDAQGNLKAVACGYACHATVLSFNQWSGDWPGFAQIEIEKRHPGTVALFWAGCGADQNPLPRRKVELAEKYGAMLADAVDRVLESGTKPLAPRVEAKYEEIDLAFGELPTREDLAADAKSDNRYVAARAKHLLETWDREGGIAGTYPYPIQVWRLGDAVTFVILGGEVVVDYALRLKSELPDTRVWVAGYSNDVMAYIPSRRVLLEGGYEGKTSMIYYGQPTVWDEDVEERIVATVKRLAKSR